MKLDCSGVSGEKRKDFANINTDSKTKELHETLSSITRMICKKEECIRDDMMGALFLLFMIGNEIPPEKWFRD